MKSIERRGRRRFGAGAISLEGSLRELIGKLCRESSGDRARAVLFGLRGRMGVVSYLAGMYEQAICM